MEYMKTLDQALAEYQQEALETMCKWVRQPSVKLPAEENAPFGPDNRKMLNIALEDCRRLGFAVKDIVMLFLILISINLITRANPNGSPL